MKSGSNGLVGPDGGLGAWFVIVAPYFSFGLKEFAWRLFVNQPAGYNEMRRFCLMLQLTLVPFILFFQFLDQGASQCRAI
ncbi:hypothetical protein [Chromobacterium sphagni]|uniref:hypothetical protein n=1 Tax=Chromobacterium sphagni TaxID=1903179 RepID=UPI0019D3D6DB|nr:hypothetical protein [Chromobacterium sphagni]